MNTDASILAWAVKCLAARFENVDVPDSDKFKIPFEIAGVPWDIIVANGKLKPPTKRLRSIFADVTLHPSRAPFNLPDSFLPSEELSPERITYPKGDGKLNLGHIPENITDILSDENRCLVFLERYGSFLPVSDRDEYRHISFYDFVKSAAAIQSCLSEPNKRDIDKPFLLVSADFSGIQNFVYTISSKGALKTLRARSFMLEMLTEHIIYEILTNGENTSHCNIIYAGGGGFALVIPNTEKNAAIVSQVKKKINDWLLEEFNGKIYLAVNHIALEAENLKDGLGDVWEQMSNALEVDKRRKFADHLTDDLFKPRMPLQLTNAEECQICHRDDVPAGGIVDLRTGSPYAKDEESVAACKNCYHLYWMGDELTSFECIYQSEQQNSQHYLSFPSLKGKAYYSVRAENGVKVEATWVKSQWELDKWKGSNKFPIMLGNYVRDVADLPECAQGIEKEEWRKQHGKQMEHPENVTASFAGLANASCGADLIGALRMDVDNLGLILSNGLPGKSNLITLSTISRHLNLFFKVYLNRICEGNLGSGSIEALDIVGKNYRKNRGRNVSVIYSGGDDLFLVGAWDEVTELAYDIQRAFKLFTCNNPDIGISGGTTLHQPTFPLYQMAKLSGKAEREAKLNFDRNPEYSYRKDSIAVFYNRYFGEQQRKIAERVRHLRDDKKIIDPGDEGKRIMLTMKWNEFADNILDVIEWFRPFMNASDKMRLRFTIELPSGFIHKLLNLVEGWQEEGKLFIPHLMWLVKKSSAMFKNDADAFDRQAKLITMFRDERLKYLHIPFTWIEYLKRGGE